ncbi:MAG TPA: glycoside hydrolase family 43 protein [Armatimonadota bacterium]|jgi:beta-xylosidase
MKLPHPNPVHPDYMADPFVLRHGGAYTAYGTAPADPSTGRVFPMLRSTDFVNWTRLGGALVPAPGARGAAHWAPEVSEQDGLFIMYYSSALGSEESHRIRTASATSPAGPFTGIGRVLLPDEGFTIDASPFRDPVTGRWYLFFAKDFLDGPRPGTGAAVVPLADDRLTPLAPPVVVARPSADWQIYERNRSHYGREWPAWHTVEGPFTVHHDGRYYCFYSGGAWHGPQYGVACAVADSPLGPWTDLGANGPNVLRGIPGRMIGPGHNSVVCGPDGCDYMVYHAWDLDMTARRMWISPLEWTPNGPKCTPEAG